MGDARHVHENSLPLPVMPEIGYVLKGYPRTSETFIANEIYLLEKLGLKLWIFSLLRLAGQQRHAVFDQIHSPVTYLPHVASLSGYPFFLWLAVTLPKFAGSHWSLLRARPRAYFTTLLDAIALTLRCREARRSPPRKEFIKEFLQAGIIAREVIESSRIRHLHAHFCHTSTSIAMFASRLAGVPFSFTAHAKDIYLKELNPGELLRIKMRRAKFIVTCTRANSIHLEKISTRRAPIHTVYHGLDTDFFAPSAEFEDKTDRRAVPIVLSVGRFVEKKGFQYLVKACRILKDRGQQFICLLVGGDGPTAEEIKRLVKELRLEETVLIRPAVTQEELRHIYRAGTVFVLPCLITDGGDRDGIPNVLVEAMAMEMPVVSTDVSGIPELVDHGLNGLLVPEKEAAALAEAIGELLGNPVLRRELGQAARNKVCHLFDARVNTLVLRDLFLSVVHRSAE
jgi:glycosyltransferase involved in cell wall biosynthesis